MRVRKAVRDDDEGGRILRKIATAWIFVAALSASGPGSGETSGPVRKAIEVGGQRREFLLHIPPNLDARRPAPLVFAFHGAGGSDSGIERMTRFDVLADRDGVIVAFPQGIAREWNGGRNPRGIPAPSKDVDDLRFVEAIIEAVSREHRVDPKRIFATGISAGGIFSSYLGARMSGRFAAVAPVVGGLAAPVAADFKPDHPVSVLVIQGTADPIMPFDGGEVAENVGKGRRGTIVSTQQALTLWVRGDGCSETPSRGEVPDRDPRDGCRAAVSTWPRGKNGTEVTFFRVEGGGHTWPGGPQYLPERIIGKVCRDFDASATIWEFFKAHPKP